MAKRKVIIDTDCGGDDAIGIMTALVADHCEVIAITATWGNVPVDQGVDNIGKLLDLFGLDIPLYRGTEGPIMGERETVAWGGFGTDGFGDADFPAPSRRNMRDKHAVVALIDTIEEATKAPNGPPVQLICLGPLTNVALALRMKPSLFDRLGADGVPGVVVMGGAIEAKGNSSLVAEFNIHCDPEAARIVLNHRGKHRPVWVVSWEVTVNCAMPWGWYDRWINRIRGREPPAKQNKMQHFIQLLFQRLEAFTRPGEDGSRADTGDDEVTQDVTCVIPDAVAVAAALYTTEVVTDVFKTYATVEVSGRDTRGALCIDWYGTELSMAKRGRWRNAQIITRCEIDAFLAAMQKIVEHPLPA